MKTIHKYPVSLRSDLRHKVPVGATFIHVDNDTRSDDLAVWAEVDPNAPTEEIMFSAFGTGGSIPDFKTYLGSALQRPFIWHVYMERMA